MVTKFVYVLKRLSGAKNVSNLSCEISHIFSIETVFFNRNSLIFAFQIYICGEGIDWYISPFYLSLMT